MGLDPAGMWFGSLRNGKGAWLQPDADFANVVGCHAKPPGLDDAITWYVVRGLRFECE